MSRGPVVIERTDLAHAWASAFNEVTQRGTDEIVPLVVCISGFEKNIVVEDVNVRNVLDEALLKSGLQSIRTVANTIFPLSLWNPHLPAEALFARYAKVANKLRHYRLNRNGIYFERMVAFQPKGSDEVFNQLQYLLDTRNAGNHRRSAYQISVIDPTQDDTHQHRRGFPCLQQVSVTPIGRDELAITGFYATQTMFERAYGNYVGLCDLGRFFAHYWKMQLTRVACVTSVAQLDTANISKTEARALAVTVNDLIPSSPEPAATMVGGIACAGN